MAHGQHEWDALASHSQAQQMTQSPLERPFPPSEFQGPPARRWTPWLGAATVVGLLGLGGYWVLSHGGSHGGDIPLIRADQSPVKVKPDTPQGVSDENGPVAYNAHADDPGGVEQLLPPPEIPMAKPVPPPQAAAPVPSAPPASVGVVPPAAMVAPPATPAPPPAAASPQTATPTARLVTSAASAPSAATAKAHASGPYRVQIAATKTAAAAKSEWQRLQRTHGDLLGGLDPDFVRADLGSRGTFYRIQAGPVADKAAAEKLCTALKRVSIGCIVVHP